MFQHFGKFQRLLDSMSKCERKIRAKVITNKAKTLLVSVLISAERDNHYTNNRVTK